jgi:hypothetical protein
MRLLGRDISTASLLADVGERLFARGLGGLPNASEVTPEGIEARVDPLSFYVGALGEHADATQGLPLETHREGLTGRAVVVAKTAFRRIGQLFINEALARQVVFNGHVRDSYSLLSSEVIALRAKVAADDAARTALASALERELFDAKARIASLEKSLTAQKKSRGPSTPPEQGSDAPAKPLSKVRVTITRVGSKKNRSR